MNNDLHKKSPRSNKDKNNFDQFFSKKIHPEQEISIKAKHSAIPENIKRETESVQEELDSMLGKKNNASVKHKKINHSLKSPFKSIKKTKDHIHFDVRSKNGSVIVPKFGKTLPSRYIVDLKDKHITHQASDYYHQHISTNKINLKTKTEKVSKPKPAVKKVSQTFTPTPAPTSHMYDTVNIAAFSPEDYNQFTAQKKKGTFSIKKSYFISGILILLFSAYFYTVISNGILAQKYTVNYTQEALENLNNGQEAWLNLDFANANTYFSTSTRLFLQANKEINSLPVWTEPALTLFPEKKAEYKTGKSILEAGSRLSLAAKYFSQGLASSDNETNLTQKLVSVKDATQKALPYVIEAEELLANIDINAIPADKQETIIKAQENLPLLKNLLENFLNIGDFAAQGLGNNTKKRYLVLFQNNAEIRPTGGFIGSFALVDMYNGHIRNIEVPGGGPYDFQGSLYENIQAPKPLQLISERWELQDSNWFPDFPTSAQKFQWFYEKSGGSSVDGVIAVNLPLMEKLLDFTGPIEMPEYDKIITADNFWIEAQKAVELEYDKEENKPKQFIGDLAPIVLEHVFSSDQSQLLELVALLNTSLQTKDIQVYLKNQQAQELIDSYGWSGKLKETNYDYLAVINTNIAGGKTDRVIDQEIHHDTRVLETGEIINTVSITKKHNGLKNELFTGVQNVNYTRFYVPQGSMLLSAQGFSNVDENLFKEQEFRSHIDSDLDVIQGQTFIDKTSQTRINNEFNKTVFGNWMMVEPGETKTATITYKLPYTIEELQNNYSLFVQKQPGANNTLFTNSVSLPQKLSFKQNQSKHYTFTQSLDTDIEFINEIITE